MTQKLRISDAFSTFSGKIYFLDKLKKENIPQFSYIKLCAVEIQEDSCNLVVPNRFIRDAIKKETLEELSKIIGREITDVIVDSSIFEDSVISEVEKITRRKGTFLFGYDVLHREFVFDSFVVGRFNEDAYNFVKGATEGKVNVVSIFSSPGLGKTHLLEAAAKKMVSDGMKVSFFTSELLAKTVKKFSRRKSLDQLMEEVEESDAVIIDDIQNIKSDMDDVQSFLFSLFNTITSKGGLFMVSSDTNPRLLPLDKRLTQRFTSGCVASIGTPDYEDKKKILYAMAKRKGIEVDAEFVELISRSSLGEDLRQLENAVNTYDFLKSINPSTSPRDVFVKILGTSDKRRENFGFLDEIVSIVSDRFGVPIELFYEERLKKGIGSVRAFCIYVASTIGISSPVLSEYFKIPRDRVRKEIYKGKKLAESVEMYKKVFEELKEKLG